MKREAPQASAATVSAAAQRHQQDYLSYLTHERRLSANTIGSYKRDIDALIQLAGDGNLGELQVHQIRRFVAQLHARGLDGRSIARMLSAWRGLYRYLVRDRGFKANPCVGIRAPKVARRLPHAQSPDEAARLMNIDEDETLALRDKAMFELFYSSGLRLSELTGLALGDINAADGTVRVTGKGGKTRVVPVGRHALAALDGWLTQRALLARGDANEDETALFLGQGGRRLGARAVQLRFKHWAAKLGLDRSLHPHVLRHSFASHVLQSSGDLRAVQEMLGHASISTTQVYTQLDFQHLAKVYDAAHPRARRKTNRRGT
ncbi:MAG TPA: tyrosine recombinase XerC [Burkholderiales bacterium]|nr:tyrosine recombinase XerC [Burkholderiales bacterium]